MEVEHIVGVEVTEIQREASASTEIQHRCIQVINDVREVLENLESPLSFIECCIYKVPDHLRKLKEEHYTPQVISIGPFHHDNRKLQTMEQLKFRYLKYFIQRVEIYIRVEDLVSPIMEYEESVRRCYAETIQLSSHSFVKIILVDAIFILELFWRYHFNDWKSEDNGASLEPWLIAAIRSDLILLENQLPFFILEKLFHLAFAFHKDYDEDLIMVMTFDYFQFYNTQNIGLSPNLKMKHFLDLLRTFLLPPFQMLPGRDNHDEVVKHVPSATQLHESGFAFKKGSSNCLFYISYTKGELKMPPITLDKSNGALFRNLLALEQCHYSDKAYITDYFILLDFLINTTKDVSLLVQKGILVNLLRNKDEARNLVNSLVENVIYVNMNSDYYAVCKELKAFYKKSFKIPWDSWMETLRHEYLNTPWRTASTFAAIILLMLTLLQTIYTIFPKK